MIRKRESSVKAAIKTFNSWKEVAGCLKILLSSITRVKSMILNDEKELNEIKAKCVDFSRLSQIDTNDPNSERWAVTFVEIQAIIGNCTPNATDGLIEFIQNNLRKLKQTLDSKILCEERNLTDRRMAVQQKVATAGRSVERVYDKSLADKRKYSDSKGIHRKYFEYHNDALMNEITATKKNVDFKYEFLRQTPEHKDPLKGPANMKLLKNDLAKQGNRRNHDKEFKSNSQKERAWQFSHERELHHNARAQGFKFTASSNEVFAKNSTDQNAALAQPMPGAKLISRQNIDMQRGRVMCLTNLNFNSKPVMEALNILGEESKGCGLCGDEGTAMITLKCCGRLCVRCMRKKLLDAEPRVLLNAFEAEKRQTSVCVCPTHRTPVGVEVLLAVFTHKEVERVSIEALKRERKEKKNGVRDINNPSLCIDCKEVIEDDLNTMRVCATHKVCRGCYQ